VLARWQIELTPRLTNDADCRVVLSFGANDTTWEDGRLRVQPRESVENLVNIITQARQASLPLFIVGPPPVNDDAQQQRITNLSQEFSRVAEQQRAPYVEIADNLRHSPLWQREIQAGDGAHPGTRGYELIADLIKPTWLQWLANARPVRAR
jgi:lysophospholipase L1-like esterase